MSTLTASALCPPAHDAHADDTHHQDYLLGSRAVGLGGAFTALGSDASGIFYNLLGSLMRAETPFQFRAIFTVLKLPLKKIYLLPWASLSSISKE